MIKMNNIITNIIIVVCLTSFSVSGQQVLDKIAAIVDDDIILQSDLAQGAYIIAMQTGIAPDREPEKFKELQRQILDNLINQNLLLIKAEQDTIEADERQVEALLEQQIQSIIAQFGSEEAMEKSFGMPISKIRRNYRKEIEKNLRARKVREQKDLGINISRREVINFYNTMKDSLPQMEEGVDISHILAEIKAGKEADDKALTKIQTIQQMLQNGDEFDVMARDFSDDPGSAKKGGDLGLMQRGDFVTEFEESAFALKPGELSGIVKTQFGYHIIQMIERRGEKINVRHILASFIPTKEDETATIERINRIHEKLVNGANFDTLATLESDDVSTKEQNGHLGFFELKQLEQTAKDFIPRVRNLKPGEFSEPFRTRFGFHILKLNRRREQRPYSVKQDWDQIEAMALQNKRQNEYLKWIDELKKDVYIEIKFDD